MTKFSLGDAQSERKTLWNCTYCPFLSFRKNRQKSLLRLVSPHTDVFRVRAHPPQRTINFGNFFDKKNSQKKGPQKKGPSKTGSPCDGKGLRAPLLRKGLLAIPLATQGAVFLRSPLLRKGLSIPLATQGAFCNPPCYARGFSRSPLRQCPQQSDGWFRDSSWFQRKWRKFALRLIFFVILMILMILRDFHFWKFFFGNFS